MQNSVYCVVFRNNFQKKGGGAKQTIYNVQLTLTSLYYTADTRDRYNIVTKLRWPKQSERQK